MGIDLAWWALILIVLGICLAAAVIGLLVSYIFLRVQKRPWPYAWLIFRRRDDYLFTGQSPVAASQQPAVEPTAGQKARKEVEDATLRLTQKWQADRENLRDGNEPGPELVQEVEADLKIAQSASETNLQPFSTAVFDSNQEKILALDELAKERLTAVYTDMRMANRLVALSQKGPPADAEVAAGYLKLCSKISTQLEFLIPSIKNPSAS